MEQLAAVALALAFASPAAPQSARPAVGGPHAAAPDCDPAPLHLAGPIAPHSAVASPQWTALFDKDSGWIGGDGVYSVPLDGDDRPCSAAGSTTYVTFSDTLIGEVSPAGAILPGAALVHNSHALLDGAHPAPAFASFHWGTDAAGEPATSIVPDTGPDDLYWPLDGWPVEGRLYFYALRMVPGGPFGVSIGGVTLLETAVDAPFADYEQTATPLFLDAPTGPVTFGRAILPNTAAAGAPAPDGFLYVYGLLEEPLNKKLLVARVPPGSIEDFGAYRYFDGGAWVAGIASAAPVAARMSAEFSVSPLDDGRFLMVYKRDDLLGTDVTVRVGDGPAGPWQAPVPVWTIPETALDPDVFTYGAKAHPHLSTPGRLLISYHVNSFEFADLFANADVYRPRFVELPLDRP